MSKAKKAFDKTKYGTLLAETIPVVIESEREYARLEAVFNNLINKGEDNLSPEESRLFALIAKLLEDYEREILSPLESTSPVDTLKFLMAENSLKQKDIIEDFGTQSVASAVLNGKREISKSAALRLGERFGVSAELFLK